MTDPRAEHDAALKAALLGPVDEAAVEAEARRELPPAPKFQLPTRGDDPEQAIVAEATTPEERRLLADGYKLLAHAGERGYRPRGWSLDPSTFEGATMFLGLPIERSGLYPPAGGTHVLTLLLHPDEQDQYTELTKAGFE